MTNQSNIKHDLMLQLTEQLEAYPLINHAVTVSDLFCAANIEYSHIALSDDQIKFINLNIELLPLYNRITSEIMHIEFDVRPIPAVMPTMLQNHLTKAIDYSFHLSNESFTDIGLLLGFVIRLCQYRDYFVDEFHIKQLLEIVYQHFPKHFSLVNELTRFYDLFPTRVQMMAKLNK